MPVSFSALPRQSDSGPGTAQGRRTTIAEASATVQAMSHGGPSGPPQPALCPITSGHLNRINAVLFVKPLRVILGPGPKGNWVSATEAGASQNGNRHRSGSATIRSSVEIRSAAGSARQRGDAAAGVTNPAPRGRLRIATGASPWNAAPIRESPRRGRLQGNVGQSLISVDELRG